MTKEEKITLLKAIIQEDKDYDWWRKATLSEIIEDLEYGSSVTPQIKTAHWVKHDTGHSTYYDCSLCGCAAPCTETADSFIWKLSNFCPDCGAKMEG